MLKATELRIGNFVTIIATKEFGRIQGVFERNEKEFIIMGNQKLPLSMVDGIGISKNILEACNFRHTKTSNDEHISFGFSTVTEEYQMYYDEEIDFFKVTVTTSSRDNKTSTNCTNKSGIKYLHELQNAFWWATRDELQFDFKVYAKALA